MLSYTMILDLLVTNARIMTTHGMVVGAVGVSSGRVSGVFARGPLPEAIETLDAGGCYLLPGVVDVHVHFREPGLEHKATYRSESSAAAVGGVTTVFDMPTNGSKAIVGLLKALARLRWVEQPSQRGPVTRTGGVK